MSNREVMQQALEALEGLFGLTSKWENGGVVVWRLGGSSEPRNAITALKAALEQQAEPTPWRDMVVVSLVREGIDKHKARELADHFAAQQQAEPVSMRMPKVGDRVICLEDESLGEVVSLTGGGSPDINFDDGTRGTYLLREFAELFGYVASPQQDEPPQRQWVGLTDEEKKILATTAGCTEDDDGHIVTEIFRLAEAKLKERNT